MRADCEVRVGTVSEGMSRLVRLLLLQRGTNMFERIHLRIDISFKRVIDLSVNEEEYKKRGLSPGDQGSLASQTSEA